MSEQGTLSYLETLNMLAVLAQHAPLEPIRMIALHCATLVNAPDEDSLTDLRALALLHARLGRNTEQRRRAKAILLGEVAPNKRG